MKHTVILISGKQGSGKSSTADLVAQILESDGLKTYRTRYAKVLYMMHDAVRDIGRKYGIDFPDKNGPLLQYLGTEVVRNNFGEDSWVNCLKTELKELKEPSFVIIDDCRFVNELKAFDNNPNFDVLKVRLEASREVRKARTNAWRDNDSHPSETGLDNFINDFNFVINTEVGGPLDTANMIVAELVNSYI